MIRHEQIDENLWKICLKFMALPGWSLAWVRFPENTVLLIGNYGEPDGDIVDTQHFFEEAVGYYYD